MVQQEEHARGHEERQEQWNPPLHLLLESLPCGLGRDEYAARAPETRTITSGYFDEKKRSVGVGAWAADEANIERVMALTARYVPELAAALGSR